MSSLPASRSPHFSNSTSTTSTPDNFPVSNHRDSGDAFFEADKSELHLDVNDSIPTTERRHPSKSRTLWHRRLAAVLPFSSRGDDDEADDALPLLSPTSSPPKRPQRLRRKSRLARCVLYPFMGFFIMLGIIQFISITCGIMISFFYDDFDRATDRWRHRQNHDTEDISHWPTDISRDIVPVKCHSHNDYWRPVPLFSALQAGCVGIEADVWLFDNGLYVGHSTSSLTPKRTLKNMYIDPLLKILEQQNPLTQFHPTPDQPLQGVFDTDPAQSLILLIDFKTDGEETWGNVITQLSPLRERGYLSHFNGTDIVNGPITVVGTGNTPFNLVTANTTYRDIFFDAPLERLAEDDISDDHPSLDPEQHTPHEQTVETENVGQGLSGISAAAIGPNTFSWTNSYYASVSFKKSIGYAWSFHLTGDQMDKIKAQIRAAHRRGLKVRYWALPSWPRSLRNHIWSVLVDEGVDMLNVDDLQSATREDWRPKLSDWWGR